MITGHAIKRYRERIDDVSDAEAMSRLTTPLVQAAIAVGAKSIALPGGGRVVLANGHVVTVLAPGQELVSHHTSKRCGKRLKHGLRNRRDAE